MTNSSYDRKIAWGYSLPHITSASVSAINFTFLSALYVVSYKFLQQDYGFLYSLYLIAIPIVQCLLSVLMQIYQEFLLVKDVKVEKSLKRLKESASKVKGEAEKVKAALAALIDNKNCSTPKDSTEEGCNGVLGPYSPAVGFTIISCDCGSKKGEKNTVKLKDLCNTGNEKGAQPPGASICFKDYSDAITKLSNGQHDEEDSLCGVKHKEGSKYCLECLLKLLRCLKDRAENKLWDEVYPIKTLINQLANDNFGLFKKALSCVLNDKACDLKKEATRLSDKFSDIDKPEYFKLGARSLTNMIKALKGIADALYDASLKTYSCKLQEDAKEFKEACEEFQQAAIELSIDAQRMTDEDKAELENFKSKFDSVKDRLKEPGGKLCTAVEKLHAISPLRLIDEIAYTVKLYEKALEDVEAAYLNAYEASGKIKKVEGFSEIINVLGGSLNEFCKPIFTKLENVNTCIKGYVDNFCKHICGRLRTTCREITICIQTGCAKICSDIKNVHDCFKGCIGSLCTNACGNIGTACNQIAEALKRFCGKECQCNCCKDVGNSESCTEASACKCNDTEGSGCVCIKCSVVHTSYKLCSCVDSFFDCHKNLVKTLCKTLCKGIDEIIPSGDGVEVTFDCTCEITDEAQAAENVNKICELLKSAVETPSKIFFDNLKSLSKCSDQCKCKCCKPEPGKDCCDDIDKPDQSECTCSAEGAETNCRCVKCCIITTSRGICKRIDGIRSKVKESVKNACKSICESIDKILEALPSNDRSPCAISCNNGSKELKCQFDEASSTCSTDCGDDSTSNCVTCPNSPDEQECNGIAENSCTVSEGQGIPDEPIKVDIENFTSSYAKTLFSSACKFGKDAAEALKSACKKVCDVNKKYDDVKKDLGDVGTELDNVCQKLEELLSGLVNDADGSSSPKRASRSEVELFICKLVHLAGVFLHVVSFFFIVLVPLISKLSRDRNEQPTEFIKVCNIDSRNGFGTKLRSNNINEDFFYSRPDTLKNINEIIAFNSQKQDNRANAVKPTTLLYALFFIHGMGYGIYDFIDFLLPTFITKDSTNYVIANNQIRAFARMSSIFLVEGLKKLLRQRVGDPALFLLISLLLVVLAVPVGFGFFILTEPIDPNPSDSDETGIDYINVISFTINDTIVASICFLSGPIFQYILMHIPYNDIEFKLFANRIYWVYVFIGTQIFFKVFLPMNRALVNYLSIVGLCAIYFMLVFPSDRLYTSRFGHFISASIYGCFQSIYFMNHNIMQNRMLSDMKYVRYRWLLYGFTALSRGASLVFVVKGFFGAIEADRHLVGASDCYSELSGIKYFLFFTLVCQMLGTFGTGLIGL